MGRQVVAGVANDAMRRFDAGLLIEPIRPTGIRIARRVDGHLHAAADLAARGRSGIRHNHYRSRLDR